MSQTCNFLFSKDFYNRTIKLYSDINLFVVHVYIYTET
jgi:hypothetical protein